MFADSGMVYTCGKIKCGTYLFISSYAKSLYIFSPSKCHINTDTHTSITSQKIKNSSREFSLNSFHPIRQ